MSATVWAATSFLGIPVAFILLCLLLSDFRRLQRLSQLICGMKLTVGSLTARLDLGLLLVYALMFLFSTRKLMNTYKNREGAWEFLPQ